MNISVLFKVTVFSAFSIDLLESTKMPPRDLPAYIDLQVYFQKYLEHISSCI